VVSRTGKYRHDTVVERAREQRGVKTGETNVGETTRSTQNSSSLGGDAR
jgi:hypothetical protein